jgi:hypothetical protein
MLVLFDTGTPRTLARYLIDEHIVTEARAWGRREKENGALLDKTLLCFAKQRILRGT